MLLPSSRGEQRDVLENQGEVALHIRIVVRPAGIARVPQPDDGEPAIVVDAFGDGAEAKSETAPAATLGDGGQRERQRDEERDGGAAHRAEGHELTC